MKYTKEQINTMRERLHESEWEGLKDRDLRQILWDGCLGWAMMNEEDVVAMFEETYGELED